MSVRWAVEETAHRTFYCTDLSRIAVRTGLADTSEGRQSTNEPWLVFGLGNPGPKYESTRHNIGQMVVAELAQRIGVNLTRTKLRTNVGTSRLPTGATPGVPGPRVVLAISTGYMNESGGPVRALADFYSIDSERIIAVHDDVDIPFDTIKAKVGGGEGGHNGLRSMTSVLGTKNYPDQGRGGTTCGTSGHRRLTCSNRFPKMNAATLPIFISDIADEEIAELLIVAGSRVCS